MGSQLRTLRHPGVCGRSRVPTAVAGPPTLGTTGPSHTSLDEDPRGPGLVLAGVPQVPLCFLRGPGAEQGERQPGAPSRPLGASSSSHGCWLHRFPPLDSRQEILHFLHRDVPSGVQRVLHAAVGGVDGARREGGRVLLGGPWGATEMGGLGGSRDTGPAPEQGPWGRGAHGRDRAITHGRCWRGSVGPRGCTEHGCRSPAAALASPSSCCWKETRGEITARAGATGQVYRVAAAAKPPCPPGHIPPEAGGVLEPGDLQPAQRLRHIPGTQREALELGRRN